MNTPKKLDCNQCGTKILPTTYEDNNGLCMPCKGGYRNQIQLGSYVNLSRQILDIKTAELGANLSKIEECAVALEQASEAAFAPKKKWWHFPKLGSGVDWLKGVGIANCSCAVTKHLQGPDLIEYRDRIARVWAKSILASCSHYHHMVGPAMIENAKIAELKGDTERLKMLCDAVAQDFQLILERWESEEVRPAKDSDDAISLKSLEFAVNKCVELEFNLKQSQELKGRLDTIWRFPEEAYD